MKSLFFQLYDFFFCCRHTRLTRLITLRKRTYAVCLGCGREFEYSWQTMSFGHRKKTTPLDSGGKLLQHQA